MSETVILVVLFGLFIGYWVVSKFLDATPPKSPKIDATPPPEPPPETAKTSAWHQVLNIPPTADKEQIRRAYQTLMSQYHPDKVAALGEELKALSARKTQEINVAYDQAMRLRESGL